MTFPQLLSACVRRHPRGQTRSDSQGYPRRVSGLFVLRILGIVVIGAAAGCASFHPAPDSYQPYLDRALTRTNGPVIASVSVLSRDEAAKLFGLALHKKHVQPVWVRLENMDTNAYYFLPASFDPNYHSAAEVGYMFRRMCASERNRRVQDFLETKRLPLVLPAQTTREGFIFSTFDPGAKHLRVEVLGEKEFRRIEFATYTPDKNYDFRKIRADTLYRPEEIRDYTLENLGEVLRNLPATTKDAKGNGAGDPINLVLVGRLEDVYLAFGRQGWDLTEALTAKNVFKLMGAFLLGRTWETSPVSPLYVFHRPQDMALQKARATIHERNHLRLWLAPFTCEGLSVVVGQISRDIGLRFTVRAPGWVTHKIDPEVDEARNYLIQEMLTSGSVYQVAMIGGVGAAPPDEPRENLTGDPYFTDGRRAVFFLSSTPILPSEVHLHQWNLPP